MRNKPLLILVAVSLLMLMIPFVSVLENSDEASAATTSYNIQGYIADANWDPVPGVTVSIMDNQGKSYSGTVDATTCFFIVSVPSNTGLSILFSAFGYTVVTCPNTTPPTSASEYRPLDLSKAAYNASTHTYTVTGTIDAQQGAVMKISPGTVNGHVTSDSNPIKNATVTLTPTADAPASVLENYLLSATTNDQGYYEITCPVGDYTLSVSGQGFKPSNPIPVTVTGNPLTTDVALEEKSMLKKYFSMDTAHLLMLIGVIVGIILAVVAWFLSRRVNDPHGLEIIDDSADENEDVRYP